MSDDGCDLSVSHVMTGHVTSTSGTLTAVEWINSKRVMELAVMELFSWHP